MPSKTSQPTKALEEKRSKWRLFGKSSNKSSEIIAEPNHQHSDNSTTGNDSHRSSATDESRSLTGGSAYSTSIPKSHLAKSSDQHTVVAGNHCSNSGLRMNGTAHDRPPKEVHAGTTTTQSGIAIEKVFQPQSVLSSSSTPSVRQETYTDPITGEVTTKTITTVVTETTTTHVTKPSRSPRGDDLDVDEERRLATEYLAVSASRDARAMHHGLKPPPRSRGSMYQAKTPTANFFHDTVGSDTSRSFYSSPEREKVDRWSSDYDSKSSGRHSSETEKHLSKPGVNHKDIPQNSGGNPQIDNHRQNLKPSETTRKQPAETRIHAQSNYIDKFAPPAGQAKFAGATRPIPPSHGLTPPIEEREEVQSSSNKRGSLSSFGGILGGKNKSKDCIGVKTDSQPVKNAVNGDKNGGKPGDEIRQKDNAVAMTSPVENHTNGGRSGGRY